MNKETINFLAAYLFEESVKIKKRLKNPLSIDECKSFNKVDKEGRLFYENLAIKIFGDFKLNINNYLKF